LKTSENNGLASAGRVQIAGVTIGFAFLAGSAFPLWATPDSSHGAEIYVWANCSACHGGLGYGGAGPRFRNDKLLSADTYVVGQILMGRGIMPAFKDRLSNEEVAAVATYIRTSWGNDFGPVSSTRVAEIRKSLTETDGDGGSPPQ
jgi:mono/diheme cytochrome c family protein